MKGAYYCEECWFRKSKDYLTWRKDLQEGECLLTKDRCKEEWQGHLKILNCPYLKNFYYNEPLPKKEKRKPEQLTLF